MAGSVTAMGDSFAALSRQQRPAAKRDSRAGNLEPLAGRAKKPITCVNGSDSDSEDDVSTLLNSGADRKFRKLLLVNTQDSCLSEVRRRTLDFTKDDKVSSSVLKQLAEIINKR